MTRANPMPDGAVVAALRERSIQPSAQRVAIAEVMLGRPRHAAADEVLDEVRRRLPFVSRATVYNTLNLFVARGLLRAFVLDDGRVVFDANVADHHHFIDDETGEIHDIPWDALRVHDVPSLDGFEVREYQVVLRGRRSGPRSPASS